MYIKNRRKHTLFLTIALVLILGCILVFGTCIDESSYEINLSECGQSPSFKHFFGTDWLGRDMFSRTLKGLSISIWLGVITSLVSCVIAVFLGVVSAFMGKKADAVIGWIIDVNMGMPHLIFLILISVLLGKGAKGIMIGVIITHWVSLARIIRAEIMQIREMQYIKASRCLGKSNKYIIINHLLPHIIPQFIVGVILLFPHAILHEASITFLGFGLPPNLPAIGVILSEAMGYLNTGMWWLAVLPGIVLIIIVRLFDVIGEQIDKLISPTSAQE